MPKRENAEKISTGFGTLDALWGGGLDRGCLVGLLLADRAQRSELAFQLAKQISSGCRATLFSLEVGRDEGSSLLKRLSGGETAFDDGDLSAAEQLSIIEAVFGELFAKLKVCYGLESLAEVREAASSSDAVVIDGLERLAETCGEGPHPTCELRRLAKESGALIVATAELDGRQARKGGPRYSDRKDKGARFDRVIIPYVPAYAFEPAAGKQGERGKLRLVCEDRAKGAISFDGAIEYSRNASRYLDVPGSVGGGKLWFALNAAPYREWCKVSQSSDKEKEAARRAKRALESMIPEGGMRPFHQSRNDSNGKDVADKILGALLEFREEIEFPPGLATCLGGYLELLKHDYPELIFVRSTPKVAEDSPKRVVYRPNYRLSRSEAVQILSEMDEKTAPIVEKAKTMSVNERFEFLHDWIAVGVDYDSSHSDECREAYGPLLHGRGNEMGIVKAWHYLCTRANLEAGATIGTYLGEQWPWSVCAFSDSGRSGSDGERRWCHVDIAADTKLSLDHARHDYFGLSDAEVFADHDAPFEMMSKYRKPCPESIEYFGHKGLALFRELEISDLLQETIDERQMRIEFQMPYRADDLALAEEEVRNAADRIALIGGGDGLRPYVKNNVRRMVFDVSFRKC